MQAPLKNFNSVSSPAFPPGVLKHRHWHWCQKEQYQTEQKKCQSLTQAMLLNPPWYFRTDQSQWRRSRLEPPYCLRPSIA
jgi:hypothetical protein